MIKNSYPADVVDLGDEDSYSAILNSLRKSSACIVVGLNANMLSAFETLVTLTGEFFDQSDAMDTSPYQEKYEHGNAKGYFSEEKYLNCLAGKRFIIQVDDEGSTVNNKKLPDEEMVEASKTLVKEGLKIAKKLMGTIEKEFELDEDILQESLGQRTTVVGTRYSQLTQDKLKKMFDDKKLVIEEGTNNVIIFPDHDDFPPLTFLMFKDGVIDGLQGQWKSEAETHFLPVTPPETSEPYLLVTTGSQMHVRLPALKPFRHRVITDPETQKEECAKSPSKSRFSVGLFFEHKNMELSPVKKDTNKPPKSPSSKKHTKEQFENFDKKIERLSESEFPEGVINHYPETVSYVQN